MVYRAVLALILAAGLAACASLPSGAPTARQFSRPPSPASTESLPSFAIIDLDQQAVRALAAYQYPGLASGLGKTAYSPNLTLMPGDLVAITIFDVSSQPVLAGAPSGNDSSGTAPAITGHSTVIPTQVVEIDGAIKIPFGGLIKVAGLTPTEAAHQIERGLKGQAHAPQAIVSLVSSVLDSVTVGGDVQHPGVVPLTVRGERVLDVIAAAGGAKYEPFDCDVQLVRHGSTVKVGLQDIVDRPADNVNVEPGDSLFILHDPRSFSVLGSAMKVSQYNFDTQNVTLAEAIARAGGPNDSLANIQNIYLLRYESKALVQGIAPPADARQSASSAPNDRLPVAYHLDLRRGGGYFLAQAVQVHDKDVIVMTDADSDQLQKILALVRGVTGIYYDIKRSAAP